MLRRRLVDLFHDVLPSRSPMVVADTPDLRRVVHRDLCAWRQVLGCEVTGRFLGLGTRVAVEALSGSCSAGTLSRLKFLVDHSTIAVQVQHLFVLKRLLLLLYLDTLLLLTQAYNVLAALLGNVLLMFLRRM